MDEYQPLQEQGSEAKDFMTFQEIFDETIYEDRGTWKEDPNKFSMTYDASIEGLPTKIIDKSEWD